MKLFVDCQLFDKGFQGTRTYLEGLYKELIKDKSIDFYFASKNPKNLEPIFGLHQNVFYVAYKSKNPIFRLLIDIPRLLYKYKIDYAHFQYRVPPIKVCKYVVTIHDVLFIDFPELYSTYTRKSYYHTFKKSATQSDIIFTVSEYSKEKIKAHFKVNNVYVHHNAIDHDFFVNESEIDHHQSSIINHQLPLIVCVSRFEPRKKQDLLLKNYLDLKLYEKYALVFIGEKTHKYHAFDQLYKNISADIKANIFFLKNINKKDYITILKKASLSVYPSVAEGFGIPPLESIAAGLTTISSKLTAMSQFEFIGDNYLFNPNDPADFREKLIFALNSKDNELTDKQNYLKQNYNWVLSANIFKDVLFKSKVI